MRYFKIISSIFKHLILAAAIVVPVMAQDEVDVSVEDESERVKQLNKRGSELFAIATPGETYNEISGEIGHSAVDMQLSGNGLLSFGIKREQQLRPAEYPYALGTMSLSVPYIAFQAKGNTEAMHLTCSVLEEQDGHVFNDIALKHLHGSVSLIHQLQIQSNVRTLYPINADVSKLAYVSTDNWVLDCFGSEIRAD